MEFILLDIVILLDKILYRDFFVKMFVYSGEKFYLNVYVIQFSVVLFFIQMIILNFYFVPFILFSLVYKPALRPVYKL